ncbi:MAG TPA: hypothetical protein VLE99_04380 [Candidatus Saccharimonadales bacterium]|nr:hypothetical protein [Candidatus Saccharimonadales bacterium]
MKIYVAARFTEKTMVQKLQAQLEASGHTITADWTQHRNVKPYNEHPIEAGAYAAEDLEGVLACDIFIYFTNPEVGAGLSAELGAALASHQLTGKPVIHVVGEHIATNTFYYHPAVKRAARIEAVLAELR